MADFLQDYSSIGAAGAAFEGFAKGYSDAQDRKMKRMEQEAQIEAMKTKMQREQDQSDLTAIAMGKAKGSDGHWQDAPLSPREQSQETLKAALGGLDISGRDALGNPNAYKGNPTLPGYIRAQTPALVGLNRNERAEESMNIRRDTQDRREHERVLTRINSNPNVKARLTQYQNLDNALGIITQSDSLTPQQIYEFQQAVRSNLGIKGSSGVGEREETYFKTAGLNAANWKQFLTGEPAAIAKDSKLLNHFKNLATIEQQNISGQFDKSLSAASGGHKSMYGRRPDLKEDLKDAIQAQKEQMQTPTLPQGMLGPAGMLGPQGMVHGGQPQQDPQITKYAQDNGLDYAHAQAILKARGYGGQ